MTLDLNLELKAPDGSEMPGDSNASKILVNSLANSFQKQNVLKIWGWVTQLSKDGKLELDIPDLQLFTALVENSETLTVLAKGQILEAIAKQSKA